MSDLQTWETLFLVIVFLFNIRATVVARQASRYDKIEVDVLSGFIN
ncbi:MAG: hypothetical protein R3332_07750 [Pseudohongiellaceae bacterium]|nr:hypothetical protein [Pseudohongiellaceae bacterium]